MASSDSPAVPVVGEYQRGDSNRDSRDSLRSRVPHQAGVVEISTLPALPSTTEQHAAPGTQKIVDPPIQSLHSPAPPAKSKWLQLGPYPIEPADTRGDAGSFCGDVPGNLLGVTAAGVLWAYNSIKSR